MCLTLPTKLVVLSTLLVAPAGAGDAETRADDPAAEVFVPDLCGQGRDAPPASSLGRLVLLTDLDKKDPYRAVVDLVASERDVADVVEFPEGRIEAAGGKLGKLLPEFVIIVTRPERIDVNSHLALLEMAAALDADPFVDFVFGYLTGATPEEALEFARRITSVQQKNTKLPKTILEFGPAANGKGSSGGPAAHAVAKGWKRSFVYHGPVEEMLEKRDRLAGHGMLRAGGHGMPDGVADGLKGTDLREHGIDLAPAVYFSGPCYCGVTHGYFQWQGSGMQRSEIEPLESFGLAAIASGVTALFAGLDPDRGETTSQEMERLWITGDALGYAAKETYDGAVLALRLPTLAFYRYEDGKRRPQRNLAVQMAGSGASRALFGDPTFAPWPAAAPPPFPLTVKDGRKTLELVWTAREGPTAYWSCTDVYHCEGGWTHRIQFRQEIPLKTAAALKTFSVSRLEAKSGPLEGRFPTAMIERWGGKAYIHVYLAFPPAGQQNVFFVERDFDVRFSFGKR